LIRQTGADHYSISLLTPHFLYGQHAYLRHSTPPAQYFLLHNTLSMQSAAFAFRQVIHGEIAFVTPFSEMIKNGDIYHPGSEPELQSCVKC